MLDYEWCNPSPAMLSGDQLPDPNRAVFQHGFYETATGFNPEAHFAAAATPHHHPFLSANPSAHFTTFLDSTAYAAGYNSSYPPAAPGFNLEPACQTGFVVVPKSEPVVGGLEFSTRLGLNLGGRTYFASTEADFVNRMYVRSRVVEAGSVNCPRCQVEGCSADLTHAKHYHRRHKVCEFHSKAATVVAAGLTQRFCQQCSRFHLLSEFDNGKRSCRRRLADHNRRRRKSHQSNQENLKSQINTSSETLTGPPPAPYSVGTQSSAVAVAISPPRISLDCSYNTAGGASSTASTSPLFY